LISRFASLCLPNKGKKRKGAIVLDHFVQPTHLHPISSSIPALTKHDRSPHTDDRKILSTRMTIVAFCDFSKDQAISGFSWTLLWTSYTIA
jgi:hypothetical protein